MAAYYAHFNNLEVDNLTLSGPTHITGMISGFVRSDISGKLYCSGGLVNADMSAINKIGSGTQTITSNSLAFGTNTLNNETISGASLNIAIGPSAFSSLQLGTQNIAIGRLTGSNATGGCYSNLLIGAYAGQNLSGASGNCLFGDVAGRTIIGGNHNVAAGYGALYNLSGGSFNIAIGQNAGSAYNASESNNIVIGKGLSGVAGESGVCRIGLSGTITDTYIAGNLYTTTQTVGDNSTKAATTAFLYNLFNNWQSDTTTVLTDGITPWTNVSSGRYLIVGKTLFYSLSINTTAAGGSGNLTLQCGIPNNFATSNVRFPLGHLVLTSKAMPAASMFFGIPSSGTKNISLRYTDSSTGGNAYLTGAMLTTVSYISINLVIEIQ